MRLASVNIRGGRDDAGYADPTRLRDALASLDADVLALQEVDRGHVRSGRVDQVALAASALGVSGEDHVRAAATLRGPDGSSYGIALVSRAAVAAWRRVELPRWPLPIPVPHERSPARGALSRRWRTHAVRPVRDEPRVALAAVLSDPAPVRTVVGTHLSFVPGVALVQLCRLVRAVADLPTPLLVLGDLNVTGPLPGVLLGAPGRWRVLDGPVTYPAARPRLRLDRALLTPASASGPHAVSATPVGSSDHRALVVQWGPPRG